MNSNKIINKCIRILLFLLFFCLISFVIEVSFFNKDFFNIGQSESRSPFLNTVGLPTRLAGLLQDAPWIEILVQRDVLAVFKSENAGVLSTCMHLKRFKMNRFRFRT